LGGFLPTFFITAWLLWRKKLLGYLLAGVLLVFSVLMGTAILAIFFVMSSQGLPTSVGIEALFVIMIMISLILSVLLLREARQENP
jgi:hypothetical protein